MKKYRYTLNLQLFSEEGDTGVETASDAGMQTQIEPSESGVNAEVAAEPEKQNNFEKAFAKKLAAEREKWDAEIKQRYGDYNDVKQVADYFREINGNADLMSLKERIEMERLQERSERENVPPEVLRRLDELEAKAAKVDEFEQQQQQEQLQQTYLSGLTEFVKDRGVEADALNQFMIDNDLRVNPSDMTRSFEIAFKAMQYDNVLKQSAEAEKNGMKKLLQAKGSIPTVPGSNNQGSVMSTPPKTFAEARTRAMQRMTGEG